MSLLELLRPWCDTLHAFAAVDENSLREDQDVMQGSLVRSIGPIEIRLPADISTSTLRQLRQAIKLMGHALLIQPQLWTAVRCIPKRRGNGHEPETFIDPSVFGVDDRSPSFRFIWEDSVMCEFSQWLLQVAELLSSDVEDAAFGDVWQQLEALDVFGVAPVGQHRVPVSFFVCLNPTEGAAFAAMLEAVSPPTLEVTHMNVDVMAALDEAMCKALDRIRSQGIGICQAQVSRAVVETTSRRRPFAFASSLRSFSRCLNVLLAPASPVMPPLQSLHHHYDSIVPNSVDQCAVLLNGPGAIHIKMGPSEVPDWLLLCRTLQLSVSRTAARHIDLALPPMHTHIVGSLTRALHSMHEPRPLTWVRVNAETSAGGRVLRELSAGSIDGSGPIEAIVGSKHVLLVLPGGSELVEVARNGVVLLPDDTADASALSTQAVPGEISVRLQMGICVQTSLSTLTAFLTTCCGERLTSLEVDIVTNATFSAPLIASMLVAFPLLTSLKLRPTQLTTMDVFLDAYRSGHCQLRVLSITSGDVGFVPFLEELASPESVITRTLQQFKLYYPDPNQPGTEIFLHALTTMLTENSVLQVLELVVPTKSESLVEEVASALRVFQGRPISSASLRGMPVKTKLTALGVLTSERGSPDRLTKAPRTVATEQQRAGAGRPRRCFDRGVLELILAFAAPCQTRVIRLVHEKYRGVMHAKVSGGSMLSASVDEAVISL